MSFSPLSHIGFGGSCHWCTEAIFLSVKGVTQVEQGWIASENDESGFSEAVIVTFNKTKVSLAMLIAVHLYTHSCTAQHSMRQKYRSAIYTFEKKQYLAATKAIDTLQKEFSDKIITMVIPFHAFKLNDEQYLNYYYNNPGKPFCQNIVNPKLQELLKKFPDLADLKKIPQSLHLLK